MSYRPNLKHLKGNAIEKAANYIVEYVRDRGLSEFPKIVTRSFNQRGYLKVYFKPHPETYQSCVIELGYDWPNKRLREEVEDRVRDMVREKLRENPINN